jgi:putative Mg2+ transporter-C (MgtC) family protein
MEVVDSVAFLASLRLDLLGRILLATVLGGAIGFEREINGKPAGLRTNILICVGATLLTDLSVHITTLGAGAAIRADPGRIAAQVVSGVGFLGAGTIIQSRGSVAGLTTAATLWVVAAIGMAVGAGHHVEAVGTATLVLLALVPLGRLEGWLHRRRTVRSIRVVAERLPEGIVDQLEDLLREEGLRVSLDEVARKPDRDEITVVFRASGSRDAFARARSRLLDAERVQGFRMGGTV